MYQKIENSTLISLDSLAEISMTLWDLKIKQKKVSRLIYRKVYKTLIEETMKEI